MEIGNEQKTETDYGLYCCLFHSIMCEGNKKASSIYISIQRNSKRELHVILFSRLAQCWRMFYRLKSIVRMNPYHFGQYLIHYQNL